MCLRSNLRFGFVPAINDLTSFFHQNISSQEQNGSTTQYTSNQKTKEQSKHNTPHNNMRKCEKNPSDSNRDSVTRTTFEASGTFHFGAVRDSLEARHSNTRQNLQLRSKILNMPNSNFKAFPPPTCGKISTRIRKWGLEIVGNEVVMSKCPKTVFFVKITDHRSIVPFRPLGGVFHTNPGAPRND